MTADQAFPAHIFDALDVKPRVYEDLIGGSVRVVEKRPEGGPITVMTSGASLLPTDSGDRVELAVEVLDGQQGAARIALRIVCDDIATNRRVPPLGTPWRNRSPFLNDTLITAIMATSSRWGDTFDEVRGADGAIAGHVRTLRLLTDAEATYATANGWPALVAAAGSVDALLDVTREDTVERAPIAGNSPVFITKLHADHPPRWLTYTGNELQSVTGLESNEYMDDAANLEVWSTDSYVKRFPWVADFVRTARAGQTALFTDDSGAFTIEDD